MKHTPRTSLRRPYRALLACVLAVGLSLAGAPAANAANPGVTVSQLTACYTTLGVGRAQVAAPAPRPMPYINTSPNVHVIGDNSQAVTYRPYLRRWTGTAWVIDRYGPTFTGTTSAMYTTWNQNGGLWSYSFTIDPSRAKYYQFGAEVWWHADAHHGSSYAYGIGEHQQYRNGYWYGTSYCTF
jgi:hypothetical protein